MFYNIFRFFFTGICFIAIFYLLEDINFLNLKNKIKNIKNIKAYNLGLSNQNQSLQMKALKKNGVYRNF